MAHSSESNGLALFLPEPYDVVWSLVVLVILAAFFYKFVMPKFQAILDERAEKIEGGMAKAANAQREADELKSQMEEELAQAQADAAKLANRLVHKLPRLLMKQDSVPKRTLRKSLAKLSIPLRLSISTP